MAAESSHAEPIQTIRALVTRVRESLHLMTQRAQANAYAAGEINTRLRPLALTRALDFLRGLKLWLPVSWRPDTFSTQSAPAHDALRYEYRRKRPPPKRRVRRRDTSDGEQGEWHEPASAVPENALDASSADESDVIADDTAPVLFPPWMLAVEQLETVAQALDVTAPHVENENAPADIFSDAPAFSLTEFFDRDLAAEYTRQLGLAALAPLVSPRNSTAQAHASPALAQVSAELLPIADLDFAAQVQAFLPTLADATTIEQSANSNLPNARSQNERILRAPHPRARDRAPTALPAIDHVAVRQTPADTDSIRADSQGDADAHRVAAFETPSEASAAPDRIAETAHLLFAARMNLSASPIAPDAAAIADEIADHHLPLAEQGVLAQISLPRMFADLFSNRRIAPDVSESVTAHDYSAPLSPPRAQPQIELRAAPPQRVPMRTVLRDSVPAPVHPAQELSNADETNSIAEAEHTPIHFTPSVEAAGALSLLADANLNDGRVVRPRSELTTYSAPGASVDISLPPFRLSDEIRARVTGFPNFFADAHGNDESRAVLPYTALARPIPAVLSPRVTRATAAPNESRLGLRFPRPITRAAPPNDFIPAAAFPGDESTHSRSAQRDWLAHADVATRAFAPPPASRVDEPAFRIEDNAAPFTVSVNARAEDSMFSFHENNFIPTSALFQTIAQPLNTLALHGKVFDGASAADSSFGISPFIETSNAPTETRDSNSETRAARSVLPPPLLRASAMASAPTMELRQSAPFLPTAQREPAGASPTAWHGSISDSFESESSASRTPDFPPRANDEDAAPRDTARNRVSASAPAPSAASASVDVNALARQVYALLKTQLRAERERHQLYRR